MAYTKCHRTRHLLIWNEIPYRHSRIFIAIVQASNPNRNSWPSPLEKTNYLQKVLSTIRLRFAVNEQRTNAKRCFAHALGEKVPGWQILWGPTWWWPVVLPSNEPNSYRHVFDRFCRRYLTRESNMVVDRCHVLILVTKKLKSFKLLTSLNKAFNFLSNVTHLRHKHVKEHCKVFAG